jgi:hypoxanthine-guanine phosphoribosyltransferase
MDLGIMIWMNITGLIHILYSCQLNFIGRAIGLTLSGTFILGLGMDMYQCQLNIPSLQR